MTTIAPETPMEALADRGENPAGAPHNCWIEIDREHHYAIVVWSEDLRFHAEYNGPREWTTQDDWAPLVDRAGWLKPATEGYLAARLHDLIKKQAGVVVEVDTVEYGGDEPNITFEVLTEYAEGETYEAWLDRIGWPVAATLINVTDPGTFNSAYLFDMREVEQ